MFANKYTHTQCTPGWEDTDTQLPAASTRHTVCDLALYSSHQRWSLPHLCQSPQVIDLVIYTAVSHCLYSGVSPILTPVPDARTPLAAGLHQQPDSSGWRQFNLHTHTGLASSCHSSCPISGHICGRQCKEADRKGWEGNIRKWDRLQWSGSGYI